MTTRTTRGKAAAATAAMPSVAEEEAEVGVKRARTVTATSKRNHKVTSAEPSEPAFDIPINLETASAEEWIDAFKSKFEAERSKVRELQEKLEAATECAPGDARSQKLVNDKRKLALEVQALKDANLQAENRVKALSAQVKKLEAGAGDAEAPKGRGRAGGRLAYSAATGQYAQDGAAELKALEAQLKEARLEAKALEKRLVAEAKAKADLQAKLDAAKLDAKQAASALKERTTDLGRTEAEVRALSKQLEGLEKKAGGAQESAALKRELAEADRRAAEAERRADRADALERQLAELVEARARADAELKGKDIEIYDKDVAAGKLAAELEDTKLALEQARAAAGQDAPGGAAKRRKRDAGRFSIQDTDGLMDRFAHLQDQYLQITSKSKGSKSGSGRGSNGSAVSAGSTDAEVTELQGKVAALESQVSDLNEMTAQQDALVQQLEASVADLQGKLSASDRRRAELHNLVQELRGNIRVFCRVRPFLPGEDEVDRPSDLAFPTGAERPGIVLSIPAPAGGRRKDATEHSFDFDQVMSPATTQDEVFTEIEPLLQSVMDGFRLCIFAYGQTGSGKTFTMEGRMGNGKLDAARGAVPRSMERLMELRDGMAAQGWAVKFSCSALEIYNEEIRDLLSDAPKGAKPLKHDIQIEKASGDAFVTNLSTVPVESEDEIYTLLRQAAKRRETATTSRNESSSRSHSVLQIRVEAKHRASRQSRAGMLNLVDLAGSERLGSEHEDKDRLKEAKNINMSLSSLLGVIQAIAAKQGHVPFRNSKLTHLLSSSLSGDGKALMFANISPRFQHANESLNTLRFASQVNQCQITSRK